MFRTLNVREAVEKEVMRFGNGSIVYTPKKWIGEKVLVVLEERPVDIIGGAMEILKPHLGGIEGVFLFGSFVRKEQTEDSDIDVLVIADKKIGLEKKGRFDFLVKTREEFAEEMKSDPTLFLRQLLSEAKPILNESLLKELKQGQSKPDYRQLLENTIGAFKNVQELLQAGKKQGLEYLDSNAVIYSLILRIRGLLVAQSLAKKQPYSNQKLESRLKANGFSEKTIKDLETVYRAERDNKKTGIKIRLADAEKLFETAKKEFIKTEKTVKG